MKKYFWGINLGLALTSYISVYAQWELPNYTQQEQHEYSFVMIDRSHHAALYDVVLEQEHHPFLFTPSPLGNAVRLASYLLGELYAAAEDSAIYEHVIEHLEGFSYRILDLYALYYQAHHDVIFQIQMTPEKQQYLLPEVGHLQERIDRIIQMFNHVIGSVQNEYTSLIQITCARMSKKTDQLLAQGF